MPGMKPHPDIIIVGAGLVGTSLAVALAPYFNIVLLEKHLPTGLITSEDDRPISLAYGSQQILQTMGVWSALATQACPIQTVEVAEKGAFGGVRFHSADYAVPALGYVVPFCQLQKALYEKASAHDNVTIVPIKSLLKIENSEAESRVTFDTINGEETLVSSLIVACDGTGSTVRELLSFSTSYEDHHEVADIIKLNLATPHHGNAFERFTAEGTLAVLPMPDPLKMQLVWTHAEKQIVDMNHVPYFFRGRLPRIVSTEKRFHYPLKTILVKEPVRPGLVLLGNAAHTIYPLAAQGFNLGLRDAASLSEIIVSAKKEHQPIGALAVLQSYLNWRQPDQHNTVRLTKGLSAAFGLQLPLLKPLRGLGMLAMDLLPPLKKRLAKQTMGIAGRLPKLMRGMELSE